MTLISMYFKLFYVIQMASIILIMCKQNLLQLLLYYFAVMSDTSRPHAPSYAPFEPICEEHICPVTKGLLVEPYQSSCCGHYFSKEAVDGLVAQDAPCPMCRAPSFRCIPDKAFKRRVHQALKVRCLSHSDCNWCGTYSDFLQHCGIRINVSIYQGLAIHIVNMLSTKHAAVQHVHTYSSYNV